jgi:hypothetical protein
VKKKSRIRRSLERLKNPFSPAATGIHS